jgi:putative transposase
VRRLGEVWGLSERRACRLAGLVRGTARYRVRRLRKDSLLVERIRDLAYRHPRYGCPRITALLRREGWRDNKKRIHRIWKVEGLSLRQKRPKRRQYGPRGEVVEKAEYRDHVWTYDFMEDRTERGGKLRFLNVVDEYTRECLAIRVERSLPAGRVIEMLEGLMATRGVPGHLRSDNGPEFIANEIQAWLEAREIKTLYIPPGSPWENPYIESFNGKFRDECLNMHVFVDVREAQQVAESWREEYNTQRPHSSLGYLTPEEFAVKKTTLSLQVV